MPYVPFTKSEFAVIAEFPDIDKVLGWQFFRGLAWWLLPLFVHMSPSCRHLRSLVLPVRVPLETPVTRVDLGIAQTLCTSAPRGVTEAKGSKGVQKIQRGPNRKMGPKGVSKALKVQRCFQCFQSMKKAHLGASRAAAVHRMAVRSRPLVPCGGCAVLCCAFCWGMSWVFWLLLVEREQNARGLWGRQ